MPDVDALVGRGCIVLAAYQPDPSLFATQLRSIAEQDVSDWTCIVAADGEPARIEAMVRETVGPDDRFAVVGFPDRAGFYRNFERGLRAVPAGATWVALADQDDSWHPTKLSTLLPRLRTAALVSGQAVVHAEGLPHQRTWRRDVGLSALFVDNQVTGSFSIFRAELLAVALPFPEPGDGAYHDHWLGLCAKVVGGLSFSEEVLQDYVQHGDNVIGESRAEPVLDRLRRAARSSSGRSSLDVFAERLEWRRRMATTLASRTVPSASQQATLRLWSGARVRLAASILAAAARRQAPPLRALTLAWAATVLPRPVPSREDAP